MNGGGPGSGIWKSTDGGETWTRLKTGLPEGPLGRIGLDVYRKRPNILYALVEGPARGRGPAAAGGGGGGGGARAGAARRRGAAGARRAARRRGAGQRRSAGPGRRRRRTRSRDRRQRHARPGSTDRTTPARRGAR